MHRVLQVPPGILCSLGHNNRRPLGVLHLFTLLYLHAAVLDFCAITVAAFTQVGKLNSYPSMPGALLALLTSRRLAVLCVQREGEVLRAASQQAARGEMQRFVGETLPRLADVLASKELLLHCFQILEQVG